jgi:hypothetical protein
VSVEQTRCYVSVEQTRLVCMICPWNTMCDVEAAHPWNRLWSRVASVIRVCGVSDSN